MSCKKVLAQALIIATYVFLMTAASSLAQEICYADFNCDTKVDITDLVMIKQTYLRADCATTSCDTDANDDDVVDLWDLVILRTEFLRRNCLPCS